MKQKQQMKKIIIIIIIIRRRRRRRILHAMNHLKMFKHIRVNEQEEDIGMRFITKSNND